MREREVQGLEGCSSLQLAREWYRFLSFRFYTIRSFQFLDPALSLFLSRTR